MANLKRPRTISKDDWDRMNTTQKVRALDSEGIKAGAQRMSKIAGRSLHAEKVAGRQGEARVVKERGTGFAKSLNDPKVRAKLGKKSIMKYNVKKESAGRRVAGKPVLKEGAEARLSSLRASLEDAYKEAVRQIEKQAKRNASRALKLAKKLK